MDSVQADIRIMWKQSSYQIQYLPVTVIMDES